MDEAIEILRQLGWSQDLLNAYATVDRHNLQWIPLTRESDDVAWFDSGNVTAENVTA